MGRGCRWRRLYSWPSISGLPEIGTIECASRAGPTCDVRDASLRDAPHHEVVRLRSSPVARIDLVEHAHVGGPVGRAAAAFVADILLRRLAAHLVGNLDDLAAARLERELDLGGLDQV